MRSMCGGRSDEIDGVAADGMAATLGAVTGATRASGTWLS
jgi:hypothetical protein